MENLDENSRDDLATENQISNTAKQNLHDSVTWIKIVAIVAIIGSGLAMLFTLFTLFTMPVPAIINIIIYAFAIYVATILLKMARNVDRGSFNIHEFSIHFLKYWKIVAILTLAGIALGILGAILVASTGMMFMQGF